jgi:hypothetical protein
MAAETYDLDRNFELGHEYEWRIDNNGADEIDLEDADFDTLPPSNVPYAARTYSS